MPANAATDMAVACGQFRQRADMPHVALTVVENGSRSGMIQQKMLGLDSASGGPFPQAYFGKNIAMQAHRDL
jgi:hypothetical protein